MKIKFLGGEDKAVLLIELFKAHNTEIESLIGVEFEQNTLKGYQTSLKHLQNYIKFTIKNQIWRLADLIIFIYEYDHYLKKEAGCKPVTVAKYIKHLKRLSIIA